jgi:hypothetical protein
MPAVVTKELIRSLASANGLNLPEARLESVLKQYENYLRLLELLDSFELDRTAEPALGFTLAIEVSASAPHPATKLVL